MAATARRVNSHLHSCNTDDIFTDRLSEPDAIEAGEQPPLPGIDLTLLGHMPCRKVGAARARQTQTCESQPDLLKTPSVALVAVQPHFEQFVTVLNRLGINIELRPLEAALCEVIRKHSEPSLAEREADMENVVALIPKARMGMLDRDFCNLVRADRELWPEAEKMRAAGKVLVGDVVPLRRGWYTEHGYSVATQMRVREVLARLGLKQGASVFGWRPNPQRLAPLNHFVF